MDQNRIARTPDVESAAWRFYRRFVLFDWWGTLSKRLEESPSAVRWGLVITAVLIGVIGRLWAQTKPSNFDFNVWLVASQSLLDGNNPYALGQFNYGPTWLGLITGFQFLSSDTSQFRLFIEIFLTAIDLGIAFVLLKKHYTLAAIVFFLSPITIAISGQHQQIDNVAILVALLATLLVVRSQTSRLAAADWAGVFLLGFSLSIKHVFLLLPVWWFLRPGPIRKRLLYLIGPYVVFGVSLLYPFLSAQNTVTRTMIEYSGANNTPVLYFLLPDQLMVWVGSWEGPKVFFAVALVFCGYLFRRVRLFEFTLLYTLCAVVFSWSIVNQYLAVPVAAMAIWMNAGFLVWMLLASVYLLGDPTSIDFPVLNQIQPNTLLDYNVVAKDLFPWIFFGWLLVAFNRQRLPTDEHSASES